MGGSAGVIERAEKDCKRSGRVLVLFAVAEVIAAAAVEAFVGAGFGLKEEGGKCLFL